MATVDQLKEALVRAHTAGDTDAAKIFADEIKRAQPPAAPAAPAYNPTEGMGWGEKALVNLGAGFDTAWQGAKQIVGRGMSDAELQEKRRIDKHLADRTTGGGLIQLAGEIAPTIPLGMGAGALATRAGGALAAARGSPIISAATGGGAAGLLMPTTSDELKVMNTVMGLAGGGVLGAVAPHVLPLAMKAGRGARNTTERIQAALPGALGERAAGRVGERRVSDLLERELPGGVPADAYTPAPGMYPSGIGPSAAVRTQSPELARLELGSRTAGGEHWQDFTRAGHEQRWQHLDDSLQGPAELQQAMAQSNAVGRQVPYAQVDPGTFNAEMQTFYNGLQQAKQSARYHGDPVVRHAVDYVERTMKGAGQVTPELLHTMRRTVAGGLKGVPGVGDEATRAAASEPFIVSLAQSMDNVLDKSSGGAWNEWKGAYSAAKRAEEAAKADINIRGKFIDEATGAPKTGVTGIDGTPELRPVALSRAIAAAGSMKRGVGKGKNILAQPSEDALNAVRRDLEAQAILQRSKAASTGGSGSDTASNLTQAMVMEMLLPTGLGISRYVQAEGGRKAQQAMQKQLAELLQDPEALRQFVTRQAQIRALRGQGPGAVPARGLIGAAGGNAATP